MFKQNNLFVLFLSISIQKDIKGDFPQKGWKRDITEFFSVRLKLYLKEVYWKRSQERQRREKVTLNFLKYSSCEFLHFLCILFTFRNLKYSCCFLLSAFLLFSSFFCECKFILKLVVKWKKTQSLLWPLLGDLFTFFGREKT